uniref:HTH CENPB-type domain-containing protein n=1 Tax=Acrobeloides nanus TaxID=290746 RepID=A0A914CW05_9BILA
MPLSVKIPSQAKKRKSDQSYSSEEDSSISAKSRKLKIYTIEEKIDIIDYAKIIGNRAAGREFNVAESSIREWRKNEEKLRKSAEATTNRTRFEVINAEKIDDLDMHLANFINNEKEIDWYKIRSKAQEIWSNICRLHPELSVDDIKINMGWISRFMSRNDMKIPKIAPPIIATANSINGHNGSITMVRKESPLDLAISTLPSTSSLWHPPLLSNGHSPPCSSSPSPTLSASSRRKCAVPKRAVDATLVINRPAAAAFL